MWALKKTPAKRAAFSRPTQPSSSQELPYLLIVCDELGLDFAVGLGSADRLAHLDVPDRAGRVDARRPDDARICTPPRHGA